MPKRRPVVRRRKRGGGEDEGHANHERWLLTYADMITLLMVLFIVMFAVSSVDSQKFKELRDSLAGAFGGSPSVMSGGAKTIGETEGISKSPSELQPGSLSDADSVQKLDQAAAAKAVRDADRVRAARNLEEAKQEVLKLQELQKQITQRLQTQGLEKSVGFAIDERGLVINIVTTSVVFPGDSAVLLPEGQQIIGALAPSLAGITNRIEIDGHTNQLPVPTVNYPSSWELSTARASSVVRFLTGLGLSPSRMTAAGYADQRPLYPATDPQSVTKNRRVEVIVLSDKPADVRALLATVVANLAKK